MFIMEQLEIIAKSGNLTVSLPQDRGNDRTIIADPVSEATSPQLQIANGAQILKAVNYQKSDEGNWAPINNPAYATYQPESLEYRAFEIVTKEARAIFNKFQSKYNI